MLIASAYEGKGELNYSLEWYEKALTLIPNEEHHSPMMLRARIYSGIGGCYLGKGDLSIALEYFIKVLEILKKLKEAGEGTSWTFKSIIYVLILQEI